MFTTLVCLHGWGGSKESFTELREALKETELKIYAPDLPGFGNEPEPGKPWTVGDYADWAAQYIRQNVNEPYALLGHSHGGRIAIALAASPPTPHSLLPTPNPPPSHLYLCAAAGIRRPKHAKRTLGLLAAKTGSALLTLPGLRAMKSRAKALLYTLLRVHDYERASEIMRQTLINVSREDMRSLLPYIAIPTDIFWGTDDTMTPLQDGEIMQKSIPQSTLHTYPNTRHRVHRDHAQEIAGVIRKNAGGS